jgi:hypothetical protein
MADGYLYLNCADCGDAWNLVRDFEHFNTYVRWEKKSFEAWLTRHVEGKCTGAMKRNDGYEIPSDERLYLSRILPGPDFPVAAPSNARPWRRGAKAGNPM